MLTIPVPMPDSKAGRVSESEFSLIYLVSSGIAKTTQKNLVSKRHTHTKKSNKRHHFICNFIILEVKKKQ